MLIDLSCDISSPQNNSSPSILSREGLDLVLVDTLWREMVSSERCRFRKLLSAAKSPNAQLSKSKEYIVPSLQQHSLTQCFPQNHGQEFRIPLNVRRSFHPCSPFQMLIVALNIVVQLLFVLICAMHF